jgi:cobalamin synthase
MAYQTHHCSAAFHCSVCLIAFLHTSLVLSVLPLFMLCAPCPFTAQFLFCAIQLLHSPPSSHMNRLHQQQPQTKSNSNNSPSLLCIMYLYLLCILCMQYSPFLYMLILTNLLHLLSALHDHYHDSSTSLVVQMRVWHHWVLC